MLKFVKRKVSYKMLLKKTVRNIGMFEYYFLVNAVRLLAMLGLMIVTTMLEVCFKGFCLAGCGL